MAIDVLAERRLQPVSSPRATSPSNEPMLSQKAGSKEGHCIGWVRRSETKLSAVSFQDSSPNSFQILRFLEFNCAFPKAISEEGCIENFRVPQT